MPSPIAAISHTGHHISGQRALEIEIPLHQIGIWIMFVHHKRSNDGGSIKGREQGRDWCWLRDSVAENLRQEVRWIRHQELGVATFWQRASATSQTERGASGLDQHGRASTARNAPRGKLPAAVTLPRPWVRSSASRNVPSCL